MLAILFTSWLLATPADQPPFPRWDPPFAALHAGTPLLDPARGGTLESPNASALRGLVEAAPGTPHGRAVVQFRFESARDDGRWFALAFRARGADSEAAGGPRYGLATVRHDPRGRSGLELAVREAGAFRVWRRAAWDGPFDPAAWHELAVTVVGGEVAFALDGREVLTSPWLDPQGAGGFGLVVSGARVAVRGFAVEPLPIAPAPPALGPLPVLVAHRGASHDAPENTRSALRLALEQGAPAVEFDVWATRDGVPVLWHDRRLARTSDWNARRAAVAGFDVPDDVTEATLAQLRTLDVGAWKHERFAGERIATLDEALELLRGRAVAVVEIKDPRAVEAVARVVRERSVERELQVISFHDAVVARVHELLPGVPTALLVGGEVPARPGASDALALLERARRAHASTLSVHATWVSEPFARACRERGVALAVWTVDDGDAARALSRLGVALLTTNRVPDVRAALSAAPR